MAKQLRTLIVDYSDEQCLNFMLKNFTEIVVALV